MMKNTPWIHIVMFVGILAPSVPAQLQASWTEVYAGAAGDDDVPRDVAIDSQRNVVVVGRESVTEPNLIVPRLVLLKYDEFGALLWSQQLVLPSGKSTAGAFVRIGSNDDIFVTGALDAGPDWVVARYDSTGALQWASEIAVAGSAQISPRGMALDDQDNSFVVGESIDQVRVTKVDAMGNESWTSITAGPDESTPVDVEMGLMNDLYVVGWARVPNKSVESSLWRFDRSSGAILWQHTTGTDRGLPTLTSDLGEALSVDSNGNALTLSTLCFVGLCDQDVLLQCVDPTGALLWETTYDALVGGMDTDAIALEIDGAGEILVAATTDSGQSDDILTLKFDAAGQLLWDAVYAGADGDDDRPDTLAVNGFGDVLVSGQVFDTGSVKKQWIGVYAPDGTLTLDQLASGSSSRQAFAGTADIAIVATATTTSVDISTSLFTRENSFTYCTAQVSSLGCIPALSTSGIPSVSDPNPFDVVAAPLTNAKNGLFFFGIQGPASLPFLDGTLCVLPPLARTQIQNTGGNTPPMADCSGALSLDVNAEIPLHPVLAPGIDVWGQFWTRDPGVPSGAHLTGGVAFSIGY